MLDQSIDMTDEVEIKYEQQSKDKKDGVWQVLQDWSDCTKICDGGYQYLQRKCVGRKNGGANCPGDEILKRVCNPQPCPKTIEIKNQEVEMSKIEVVQNT